MNNTITRKNPDDIHEQINMLSPSKEELLEEEARNNYELRHWLQSVSKDIICSKHWASISNIFFICENTDEKIFLNRNTNEVYSILKDNDTSYDVDYPPYKNKWTLTPKEQVVEELQFELAKARGIVAYSRENISAKREAIRDARVALRDEVRS